MPANVIGTFALGGELEINRLGFGAMRITGKGVWGPPPDRNAALALLRHVVESGVNFIDTADSYGPNVSEELIAEALHPYPAGLVIATKGGLVRPGPDNWQQDCRPERIRECCEGSLRRLKLDRIDLYQLHRIDSKVPFEDQMGVLKDLQDEGKIRHIGLSEISVEDLRRAQKQIRVVSVQNKYNLTDRASEVLLDVCGQEQIGFIPWYPLASGELSKPGGKLAKTAEHCRASVSQVALAWLLERSPVMLPIPGTGSIEHFDDNMGALDVDLSDADFESLKVA
jgi:aryl-alcohol dehydrogenase-like predicted oxidoreductase